MLDALRFVAAAVAKKDFVQDLTHFKIKNGRITGFNGDLALSSSIDVDLDIQPNASKLLSAIKACKETISLHMTPANKLVVKSGKFKSFVDCLADESAMFVEPTGKEVDLGEGFIPGIKALAPVMGIDASRPWAMGIKLKGQSMFATNNVMLTEYWHGTEIPFDVVLPDIAVNELIRVGQTPTKVWMTDHNITFWFGEDRWLWSKLLEGGAWPTDKMGQILAKSDGAQLPFPEGFFEAVETLKPFLGESGSLYVTAEALATSKNDGEGTSIEVSLPVVEGMQAYHQKQLSLLSQVAKTIDWTAYPAPCMFTGERLRGAIVGQRV